MASITEVILFVSTASKACDELFQFLQHNPVQLSIVRLDTQEDRQSALTGQYFQIKQVPTMVVVRDDGNLQLFVGCPNIMRWLSEALGRNKPPQPPPQYQPSQYAPPQYHPSQPPPSHHAPPDYETEELPKHKPKPKSKKKKVTYEEPPKRKKKSAPPPKRKTKGKRDDVLFVEEEEQPRRQPQPTGFGVGGNSNVDRKKTAGNNIMEAAKRMEEERQAALGVAQERYRQ